jgi:hypothetical protein
MPPSSTSSSPIPFAASATFSVTDARVVSRVGGEPDLSLSASCCVDDSECLSVCLLAVLCIWLM